MYRVRVHIENYNVFLDENVWVDIMLPAPPRTGETIYLKERHLRDLQEKARKDLDVAKEYLYAWKEHTFTNDREATEDDLKEFDEIFLDQATDVMSVVYEANEERIKVELGIFGHPKS